MYDVATHPDLQQVNDLINCSIERLLEAEAVAYGTEVAHMHGETYRRAGELQYLRDQEAATIRAIQRNT